ncbi:MAG: hypothetical protein C0434_00040 [Xanthomonadaceae bacterium]|nr:hypothetical protein [Xanthomonadaceae bacterium]
MNIQNPISETRSSILGVTGLSRPVLAELFRRRGLFGRDSQLGHAEQAVVQSRLPAIDGIARLPVTVLQTPRLKALAAYVEALVAGGDAGAERSRLQREGLPSAAILEAAVTVDNVRTVFGPIVTGRAARPASADERTVPQYARAA